jgi:hypothetical protein
LDFWAFFLLLNSFDSTFLVQVVQSACCWNDALSDYVKGLYSVIRWQLPLLITAKTIYLLLGLVLLE